MKTSFNLLLMAFMAIVLNACNSGSSVRSFIPGTYANFSQGEFSIAHDTLVFSHPSENSDTYQVNRKTSYQLVSSGKLGKLQHEKQLWTAVYDEKTGMMQETRMGKVITLFPDSGFILVGKRKYIKLAD